LQRIDFTPFGCEIAGANLGEIKYPSKLSLNWMAKILLGPGFKNLNHEEDIKLGVWEYSLYLKS
jgi:hypothetical protein